MQRSAQHSYTDVLTAAAIDPATGRFTVDDSCKCGVSSITLVFSKFMLHFASFSSLEKNCSSYEFYGSLVAMVNSLFSPLVV